MILIVIKRHMPCDGSSLLHGHIADTGNQLQWRISSKVMERKKRPQTRYQLYGELALAQRVLRDFADAELDRIRVDSRLTYEALLEFTSEYIPEMTSKLEHYTGRQP